MSAERYAVYLTSATSTQASGYVYNIVIWDGTSSWSPPSGSAAVADPDSNYPIGSTYTAS
ncbi:hypothetical protein [Acetobacter sp. DsW_063]|uniref:hypothetical protein n=1 Tax=Acetobacter sp. DsW_063 TaxID=1514894 RepID=UPI000A372ED7|nr:hypothetical protein [Acetobacter sp. DsW_063]